MIGIGSLMTNNQQPVSNWYDKQDLLEAVRKALRNTMLAGSGLQMWQPDIHTQAQQLIECIIAIRYIFCKPDS